jgi:hypothetical protein
MISTTNFPKIQRPMIHAQLFGSTPHPLIIATTFTAHVIKNRKTIAKTFSTLQLNFIFPPLSLRFM